jgi:hypothetical protein
MTRSALIVATDRYEDEKLSALRAPAHDAVALARVLGDQAIGDFKVSTCINPREHELRRTVSAFFSNRSPGDVLLLHFGCHGVKDDDGRLYFAAADTDFDQLDATALSADFVNRRMNDSRSKRIVLFLDCCYSGAFAKGMTPRGGNTVEVKERFEGTGRVVLTASSAMEYSFEGDHRQGQGRRSVFTSALVQGLESGEADRDRDNWISVDELYDYVFERVREQTPNQTPGKWSFVQGDVLVARSRYAPPVKQRDLPGPAKPTLTEWLRSLAPTARILGCAAVLTFVIGALVGWIATAEIVADEDVRQLLSGAIRALPLAVVLVVFARSRLTWPLATVLAATLGGALSFAASQAFAATTLLFWISGNVAKAVASLAAGWSPRLVLSGSLFGAVAAAIWYQLFRDLDAGDSELLRILVDYALPGMFTGTAIAVAIALAPRVSTRA